MSDAHYPRHPMISNLKSALERRMEKPGDPWRRIPDKSRSSHRPRVHVQGLRSFGNMNMYYLSIIVYVLSGTPVNISSTEPVPAHSRVQDGKASSPGAFESADPSVLKLIAADKAAWRTWQRFTRHRKYSLASPKDLGFQEQDERYRPYGVGNFNHDHGSEDFAVIVVDRSRTDPDRFGIVIFNARKNGKRCDGPYWLYRHANLFSGSLTSISRGPLIVAIVNTNEPSLKCEAIWRTRLKHYSCK